MKKKYTHIFFDLDNTLWDFTKNSYNALLKTFSFYSLQNHNDDYTLFFETYSKRNKLLWIDYRKGKISKDELKILRFQQTFNDLNIEGVDPDEVNTFYLTEMSRQVNLKEGAADLLDFLQRKGYLLYIITNGFREVQYEKLENTGLKKYFNKVFISEEIKASKPAKEIFEYAIKSANAKKKTSLMVGDEWETDVLGAVHAEMDVVWLNDQNLQPLFPGNPENQLGSVLHIRTLNDLKKHLTWHHYF
jgi:putative hydrolase of the HAD superfamily